VGIDANFRLKRKKVSTEERDPSLNEGWAFFVEEGPYKEHLAKHWDQKQSVSWRRHLHIWEFLPNFVCQRSNCVNHDAVNKPDREARGLAASGVLTIDCARHNLKRPNGVGDVQAGER